MDEKELKAQLDQLAEIKAALDLLEMQKQEMIDSVLTPEIRAQVRDIEAEFAMKSGAALENYAMLEGDIKAAVIENGATVKGSHLQAVFVKGRVSWDTKTLDGLMIAIPQLERARKVGDPSVSIRKV